MSNNPNEEQPKKQQKKQPNFMQKPHIKHFFNRSKNSLQRVSKTFLVGGGIGARIVKGEKFTPVMLRESFEEMGTTYIKIGQFIASMPSVFPRDYVEAFQGCLDQTTPLPFSYIKQVLTEELLNTDGASGDVFNNDNFNNDNSIDGNKKPKTLSDYFSHIEETPIASASIAQVHAATLIDGTEVVLKVQKPNVATIIETDLGMLFGASKLMDLLFPEIKIASISPILDEIRTQMSFETDFVNEAKNIADFHTFLEDSKNNQVTAPTVIDTLTSRRVLTMTRLHGVSMIDTDAMKNYCSDPANVIAQTINTWFSSVMTAKSFHADLHAGNLMLLKDGRIGFIDFGIVGHVKPESWQACTGMMTAIQTHDHRMMAECMIDIGMTKDRSQIDVFQLETDIKATIEMVSNNQHLADTIKTINPQNIKQPMDEMNYLLLELMEVAKRHGIQFPRDFILLIKQMLYFDRFLQVLAPDMSMFDDKHINMMG